MAPTPFPFALSYAFSILLAIDSEEYENPANAALKLRASQLRIREDFSRDETGISFFPGMVGRRGEAMET
jgi:hypothetical protein